MSGARGKLSLECFDRYFYRDGCHIVKVNSRVRGMKIIYVYRSSSTVNENK